MAGDIVIGGGSSTNVRESSAPDDSFIQNSTAGSTIVGKISSAAVSVDDFVFDIGGKESASSFTADIEKWNISGDSPSKVGALNTARKGHGSAVTNEQIYTLGGVDSSDNVLTSIEKTNPYTGETITIPATLTEGKQNLPAVAADGAIYLFGGENGSGTALDTVEKFDPSSGQTTAVTTLSEPKTRAAAAKGRDGNIYIFGGWNGTSGYLDTIEKFDPSTESCTTVGTMSKAKRSSVAVSSGPYIYILGGMDSGGAKVDDVSIFHPESNSYTLHDSIGWILSSADSDMSAVNMNGSIIELGGVARAGNSYSPQIIEPFKQVFTAQSLTLVVATEGVLYADYRGPKEDWLIAKAGETVRWSAENGQLYTLE